jgi:hypothetical protein
MSKCLTVVALALLVLTGAMGLRSIVAANASTLSASNVSAPAIWANGGGPVPPIKGGGGGFWANGGGPVPPIKGGGGGFWANGGGPVPPIKGGGGGFTANGGGPVPPIKGGGGGIN